MEIKDLEASPDINDLEAHVCVIGSGPAGGIVAAKLAEKNVDVLLLEAGSDFPDYSTETIAGTSLFSKVTDLRFGWSKQFGGSSNLWSGRSYPLEDIDLKERDWIPESGWPFAPEVLSAYYEEAADIIGVPAYEGFASWHNIERKPSDLDPLFDEKGSLSVKPFQWGKKPFIVSDYLRSRAAELPGLRVLLNAPVIRLQEAEDASAVRTAEIRKADGSSVFVKAKIFVVATGGIQAPRLLLNSNEVRPAGIGNDHDVVGRYFSTHPKADMAAIILKKAVPTAHAFFVDRPLGAGSLRYGVGLSEAAQARLNVPNHYVQLSPVLEYQANRAFEAMKKTKVLNNDLIDRSRLVQGFLPGLGKLVFEIIGRIAKFQPRSKKFILRAFLDQYPDRENRIKLSSEKSEDGTYKAEIVWRFSDEDKQSVLKFFAELDTVLRGQNIGEVEYSGLEKQKDWPLVGIHSHFMGSTRMGHDPKTSVTDSNAKVHGSDNLYIAGPSLFPTYGFANPFLTLSALSLRLADHLLSEIK